MNRIFKMLLALCCLVIAMSFVACCKKLKRHPCRLFIYGSYSKVYQIDFNGKDSIQTICGDLKFDSHVKNGKIINLPSPFSCIYMQKAKRLKKAQACNLISILERLNSKVITDTIKGEIRDTWNIRLFLEKQDVNLQTYGIKDPDIKMLVDSLVEYSPLFINVYSNEWFGLENELEMIRMYDKRKNR